MQFTTYSTMQRKIHKTRDQIINKLNQLGIEYSVEDMEVEKEDLSATLIGYKFKSSNLMGCVIPNFNSKRPEFLVFNEKLVEHLLSEGHDEEFIEKNGKVWSHLLKPAQFVEMFRVAHNIKN